MSNHLELVEIFDTMQINSDNVQKVSLDMWRKPKPVDELMDGWMDGWMDDKRVEPEVGEDSLPDSSPCQRGR